jgi:predicted DNA-binding transcriptional regulator YafY
MSNVHRIMWFDQAIRQHRYPNCSSLAKHFEISLRQANRDIEYLKNTMNAPLRYVAVKRGFTYDDMTFILPNLVITAQERKALSFLAHRYDNFDGSAGSRRIARLFKSLSESDEADSRTPGWRVPGDTHCSGCQDVL